MVHTKARSAKKRRPALEPAAPAPGKSIPPADSTFGEELPTQSYVREITKPPPAPRSSKRSGKSRKQKSDSEPKVGAHSAAQVALLAPYEEKVKRPTLDACIERYAGERAIDAVRASAESYHTARTRTFTTAVCAGVMDFLDDHSRRHMRFSVNALSLLVDPQVEELERRLSRDVVEPPRLRKLKRFSSEWKASTADGRILVALGLAWQLRVNTPEQRVAARKEQLEKARVALDKLQGLIEGEQVPPQLRGLVTEWKLPPGTRDELVSRIMKVE